MYIHIEEETLNEDLRRGGDLWVRTELLAISGTVRSADLGECVYLTEGLNSQEGPKLG